MDSVEKVVSVPRKLFEDASSCSEWTRDFALAQIGKLVLEAEDDTDEAFEQLRDDRDQWRQMVGHICATIPTADILASTETSQKTVDYFKSLQQRLAAAEQRNAELVKLLRIMAGDYARCLEAGYDRITFLGGDCDSVEKMLNDNPNYAKAIAALKPAESGASA